jgi:arylsulfatase A-like enzyme
MNFDLFPTAHNLAGAALPQDRIIDGKVILPVLKGETPSPHSALFYYDTRNVVAIRHQQRKYVRRHLTDIAAYWPLK